MTNSPFYFPFTQKEQTTQAFIGKRLAHAGAGTLPTPAFTSNM
jgi:hypothetical protein